MRFAIFLHARRQRKQELLNFLTSGSHFNGLTKKTFYGPNKILIEWKFNV